MIVGVPLFSCESMDLDFVSVNQHAKKGEKDLANIQPSWPHTWSITHIYRFSHAYYSACGLVIFFSVKFQQIKSNKTKCK